MWHEERNGKHRYFERYNDPISGRPRRVSVTLDKKQDKKAFALLQAKIKDATLPAGTFTLDEAKRLYLKDMKKTVQESTYYDREKNIETIVGILGGDNYMDRLTAAYIRARLLSTDKKAVTLNEYIKRFKTFARWAYRNDLLTSTACVDKLSPFKEPPRREKLEHKYLESAEFKKLLDGMDDKGYRLITEFLGLSGLRIGEAIAINTADITADSISIEKSYDLKHHKTKSTKTESSFRVLHLQPELKNCVDRLTAFMERRKMLVGVPSDFWLVNRKGKRLLYDSYLDYLREASEKVLGRPITPHVLRHTHASLLAENDVKLDIISRRLGHKDSGITKEIYLHVTEKRRKKDAEAIDAVSIICPHSAPKKSEMFSEHQKSPIK